jgi:hypothetical protein
MEFSEIRAVLESAFKPLEIGLWHDYELNQVQPQGGREDV